MTASELKYLIAIDELYKENTEVKQSDLATRLCVTKVSAFNAMERLCEKGFVEKNKRKLSLTESGRSVLSDYQSIIGFMASHLSYHCGVPVETAYQDALNAVCALSDETRNGIARFLEKLQGCDIRGKELL